MDFVARLLDAVREIVRENIDQSAPILLYGEVLGVAPIKIRVKDTYEVDEDFLILDSRCKETWIKIPTDGEPEHEHDEDDKLCDLTFAFNPGAGGATLSISGDVTVVDPTLSTGNGTVHLKHKHKIEKSLEKICLWRGLKAGDRVKILRIGSVHIVLERLEGITNDTDS